MNSVRKVTTFTGRATGDCECFCFDRRTKEQHEHDETLTLRVRCTRDRQNRIYPDDLLPDGSNHSSGKWTITVDFTPDTPRQRPNPK